MSQRGAVVGFALAMVICSWAGLKPLGENYSLIGNLTGHQQNLTMGISGFGGFVSWQNNNTGGQGDRVYIQNLGPGFAGQGVGQLVGPEIQNGPEENPALAIMTDGGAAVVWEGGPRYAKDVFIRMIGKTGTFTTGVAVVNTFRDGPQRAPCVVALANGDVIVAWMSKAQDGSGEGIFAQRFTSLGVKVGLEFMINQSTKLDQISPALMAIPTGGFIVAWVTAVVKGVTRDGAPNLRGNVVGRFFDNEGRATGNEYQLNANDALCSQPFLTTHPSGGFVATWAQQDEILKANLTDVYVRRYTSTGLPEGLETRHNANVIGRQAAPVVAFVGQTGLVGWETGTQNDSGYEIHARLLTGGAEFRVNTRTELLQRKPVLVTSSDSFIAGWIDVVSAGKSVLSAQQFQLANGQGDITAGANVSTGPVPTRTILLTANLREKIDDSARQDLQRQAEQLLIRNQQVRENYLSEAAMISRQAAARNAAMKLSSRAKSNLLPPVVAPRVQSQPNTVMRTAAAQAAARAAAAANEAKLDAGAAQSLPPVIRTSPLNVLKTADKASANTVSSRTIRSPNLPRYRVGLSRTMMSQSRTSLTQSARRSQSASYARDLMQRQAQQSSMANRISTQARQSLANYVSSSRTSNLKKSLATPWAAYRPRTSSTTMNARNGRLNLRSVNQIPMNHSTVNRSSRGNMAQSSAQRLATMRRSTTGRTGKMRSQPSIPVNARLTRQGNNLNLHWDTRMGRSYQVERSTDGQNWKRVGAPRRGTGRGDSMPVIPGSMPMSFRVVPRN